IVFEQAANSEFFNGLLQRAVPLSGDGPFSSFFAEKSGLRTFRSPMTYRESHSIASILRQKRTFPKQISGRRQYRTLPIDRESSRLPAC
ncbi:MAG: hypothetical protein ACLFOY_08105, partial [Desulfatibacillaceae bacterium]